MARDDWFRHRHWDKKIEAAFYEKLRRARSKDQYLRIQACMLAETHPLVALKLLNEYFELDDRFDDAQAFVDQATAYLSLKETEKAIASYEKALGYEAKFPNIRTLAYLELSWLIATEKIEELYPRALEILNTNRTSPSFPVHKFQWHAAKALIHSEQGQKLLAARHAEKAIDAARNTDSGYRYHRDLGLVGDQFNELRIQMETLCDVKFE